ncbi:hypothetical protein [uncultured Enterococcus sp.]|uniref:hypothetical protein n=1 Tax=uncultured Enterococcus sp. TaxID=167972 RepID=UPI0025FFF929|nr:hypothetical protein [uncultured Enterococcus sp.]
MIDFQGILMGLLIAGGLYFLDRYLPKWFGALPGIAFFILMMYIFITKNNPFFSTLLILLVGEAIINGIWLDALENKKKKMQKQLEAMKAKDLMRKNS